MLKTLSRLAVIVIAVFILYVWGEKLLIGVRDGFNYVYNEFFKGTVIDINEVEELEVMDGLRR